ncbi:hypothetical protein LK533_02490 [Sphingomonas sp. PL-96]|uniref:hypothetical protein n=1 Tax=Sphingomonas sp. PL-96 TaxID=2887201 RepID=UPI001E5EFE05|nr:hypothetical protein [Sphingomonas sp. PL-96]MCC2975542.1 hypothetical protein [Sphingomonas sp. PL-96]
MTILQKIDQFLHVTGMPPTVFGREAVHDPRLVGDLRNGREPRPDTVARIESYIARQEHHA